MPVIHSISTLYFKGRYGRGSGQEYLKYFMVEYRQRPSFHAQWTLYTDKNSRQVSDANPITRSRVHYHPNFGRRRKESRVDSTDSAGGAFMRRGVW